MTSRSWVYTLNNYTEEERDALRAVESMKYHVFGYECGENGTPHLQGYIHFSNKKSLKQMKKISERAHWEVRKGTIDQAVDYCKKDGKFEEFGSKPLNQKEKGEKEQKRWREIYDHAREGDEDWLVENQPQVAFKHMNLFRSHKKPKTEPLSYTESPHEWWFGETGTGKSRKIWAEYPNHYPKMKNKWWCNYTGQDVVVIEEADPKNMEHLASKMKEWADRYPFAGEIKGGRLEGIRPKKIIVTSNYTPEECFPNQNDLDPILRRFKVTRFSHGYTTEI